MTVTADIGGGQLAELAKQALAGHDVLLTQDSKPVARLVPAVEDSLAFGAPLHIPTFTSHQVLTPSISGAEIAEELFGRS